MRDYINLGLKLLVICLVGALVLAGTNMMTADRISEQKEAAAKQAFTAVLPNATKIESTSLVDEKMGVTRAVVGVDDSGNVVGYGVKIVTKGYSKGLELIIGINADGTFSGFRVGTSNETPGLGSKLSLAEFQEQFEGAIAPVELKKNINAISGATISSKAAVNAANTAMDFVNAHRAQFVPDAQ